MALENLALNLCDEHGLSFDRSFAQQFYITQGAVPDFPSFSQIQFGSWTVNHGATLPCAHAQQTDIQAVILGAAVDADGVFVTSERLEKILTNVRTLEAFEDYITACGGRYCALVRDDTRARFYMDPCGTLGVVLNKDSKVIASTPFLALDSEMQKDSAYPHADDRRYAFGYMADQRLTSPIPNHYVDMDSFAQTRHWPKDNSDFVCRDLDELNAGMDQVIKRHVQIMTALDSHFSPSILPLSGGEDSRMLLSMSHANGCNIDHYFSHIVNHFSSRDAEVSQALADRLGVPLHIYNTMDDDNPIVPKRKSIRFLCEQAIARSSVGYVASDYKPRRRLFKVQSRMINSTLCPPRGGVLMRGHVTDISKAVLWRSMGISEYSQAPSTPTSPELGVRMMMIDDGQAEQDPWFQNEYRNWSETLPAGCARRHIDFMGLEQFRSYSIGGSFYGTTRNFYIAPGNDRMIIGHLISAPPQMRYDFHYNDMLFARCTPELLDIPYAGGHHNSLRKRRISLMDNLEHYELS